MRILESLGAESPGVADELSRLSGKVSGWVAEAGEALDEAKSISFVTEVRRLEGIVPPLIAVMESLMDLDLQKAIDNLEELTR